MSGYTYCACRDCFDETISSDVEKPELCGPCTEASCIVYQGAWNPDHCDNVTDPLRFECQRDGVYVE